MLRAALSASCAFLVVVALSAGTNLLFERFADIEAYMGASDRVVQLSASAEDSLARMIRENDVTWDPTNGARMAEVLSLLKVTEKPRILMVGSSQFLTLIDDASAAATKRRVDRVLMRLSRKPVEVYNLSKGGMTAPDKAVVIRRAAQLMNFDAVIVGITAWDSRIPNLYVQLPERIVHRAPNEGQAGLDYWLNPSGINAAVKRRIWSLLEDVSPFIRRRSAIQIWMRDETLGRLPGATTRPPVRVARAKTNPPLQYLYNAAEKQLILTNVTKLLDSLGFLRRTSRVLVVLTPVRPNDLMPAYAPEFYAEFKHVVKASCRANDFELLDTTNLLDASHFPGVYTTGAEAGRVDVLHFDSAGHKLLAQSLARHLQLD